MGEARRGSGGSPRLMLQVKQVCGSDLSTHAGVDHGEEGGWDLDEGDSPHEGGGNVSGQIPDDASAQRDAAGIPIHFVLRERGRRRSGTVSPSDGATRCIFSKEE
jgi:hypothetical protein